MQEKKNKKLPNRKGLREEQTHIEKRGAVVLFQFLLTLTFLFCILQVNCQVLCTPFSTTLLTCEVVWKMKRIQLFLCQYYVSAEQRPIWIEWIKYWVLKFFLKLCFTLTFCSVSSEGTTWPKHYYIWISCSPHGDYCCGNLLLFLIAEEQKPSLCTHIY